MSLTQRLVNRAWTDLLHEAKGGAQDFLFPEGEPALMAADSVAWQVFKNPITMLIGGTAAVILELAEPRVCHGVWTNTYFRHNPLKRMRRTGIATVMSVYGPSSHSRAMIEAVTRMHGKVSGHTGSGRAYSASDPELLTWVHATAIFGFLSAREKFVAPFTSEQRDHYYKEVSVTAHLYGVPRPPLSALEMGQLLEAGEAMCGPSSELNDFLDMMCRAPLLPGMQRLLQPSLVKAAICLLPDWAHRKLQLGQRWNLADWQLQLINMAARAADTVVAPSSPAVLACRRLGLPENYLYGR